MLSQQQTDTIESIIEMSFEDLTIVPQKEDNKFKISFEYTEQDEVEREFKSIRFNELRNILISNEQFKSVTDASFVDRKRTANGGTKFEFYIQIEKY